MNSKEYLNQLVVLFRKHKNSANAEPMKKYMRNQFDFLGLKTPERNQLLKDFMKEYGKPEMEQLEEIVRGLWTQPEREFQNVAMGLLDVSKKKLTLLHLDLLEELVVTKSWWDTVDYLAINPIGRVLEGNEQVIEKYIKDWMNSPNIWLNRTAILFQLKYKEKTDEALLYDIIKRFASSDEFFIQKAIGWALREYSKTNPQSVIDFIAHTKLSSLSKREGLKVVKKNALI